MSSSPIPPKTDRSLTSIIALGTLLEWAEYTFYGYMTLTISALFFPSMLPQIAILKTLGIFAVGYLMRPFGAIFFGHIGDRYGRKPALMISIVLMGLATFAIGCLPTYETIGQRAPILLLILRIVQGFAVSGEYNGAGIFLVEQSKGQYPCLAGSWISAAAATGMVLGGTAAYLTSLPGVPEWSWRLPFLLSGITCIVGMQLRKYAIKGSHFDHHNHSVGIPILNLFRLYKKSIAITVLIASFICIYGYIGNVYVVIFLRQFVDLPQHHASFFALFGEAVVAVLIPLMGYSADRTDPYSQFHWGLLFVAVAAPFIFFLANTGNYSTIYLAMVLYGISNSIVCGPVVKILCDQFPKHIRYTGISLAWSIAALFSGSAPIMAQYLSIHAGALGPSVLVSVVALLTFFAFFALRSHSKNLNIGEYY